MVRYGQQRVLMSGVELLRIAGEGFGARTERKVSQAAFFEFGKFAADIVRRAGDDARHAVLAAQRDADLRAGQPLFADERAKSFCQLDDALLCVERIGFLAPANRSRDDAVAGIFVICGAHDEREVQHRAANFDDREAAFRWLASLAAAAALCLRCVGLLYVGSTWMYPLIHQNSRLHAASGGAGDAGGRYIDRAGNCAVGGGRRIGSARRIAAGRWRCLAR